MNKDYTNEDLEASLKRAFADRRADFIIMDGQTMRNQFLVDSVNYGIGQGWLKPGEDIDEDKALGQGLGQYFAYTYRLTEKGAKHFGVKK